MRNDRGLWKKFALFFLLGICPGQATELQPWLGNPFEFECRPSLLYQNYSHLSSGSHDKRYSSNDFFLNASLINSLPYFGLEMEVMGAWTRRQKSDVDQVKMTGRYVWQDDVAGDPISFVTGMSLIHAFQSSLKDVSSFHHGLGEAEVFLSLGKEYLNGEALSSRFWGVLALGAAAERGSPWYRLNIAYEKWLYLKHAMRFLVHSLAGAGSKHLRPHHFEGYGPIQHQSIDLGIRYTYLVDFFGDASLEYTYRIHARNFPEQTHRLILQVTGTFGL